MTRAEACKTSSEKAHDETHKLRHADVLVAWQNHAFVLVHALQRPAHNDGVGHAPPLVAAFRARQHRWACQMQVAQRGVLLHATLMLDKRHA